LSGGIVALHKGYKYNMIKAFLPSLSKAINAYLNLDPDSKQRAKKLMEKQLR